MLSARQLKQIRQLVAKYEALSPTDRRRYQETEVRTNFIDPLFAAIGWDMDDRAQVERETSVIEGKRPDYIFKLDGIPHLFLEAKRFTEDARAEQWARDAITKAYNKGVGWAAVTNFTDLVVYDSYQLLPAGQPPRTVIDLTRDRYADPASLLHELSPHSLREHLVEKRAQEEGIRTRVIPIEKRLYESMRGWRESLFNALYQIKQWKTEAEFSQGDEAIQRLIDRLLFLRNCEDRGIAGTDLRGLRNRIRARDRTVRVTESLLRLFDQAESTYDSELFSAHANIDLLLRGTGTVLDETLGQIIEGLYAVPQSYSEYDFAQMEPDVLGEVYEQYLGYVPQRVRSLAAQVPLPGMPAQEITLEAKRQRRKEHGIYYTPRWVVQYIVQQTLVRFLEEHQDRPDDIDNLTILDPACGSGSFLIRAYETLLEYHAAGMGGDIGHMDKRTRERILRRNIYGVDLDPQAVEIARLNLLIRMVRQQELLPELKDHIQRGNSLIEGDEAALRPFFGDDWEGKHPFRWTQRFPKVMERGGFDIIIGNPPYVKTLALKEAHGSELRYLRDHYLSAATRNIDIYLPFIERAFSLLRPSGRLGFIVPNKFFRTEMGAALRKHLADHRAVEHVVDFQHLQVFPTSTTYTCLLFLKRTPLRQFFYIRYPDFQIPPRPGDSQSLTSWSRLPATALSAAPWSFPSDQGRKLFERLTAETEPLDATCDVFQGMGSRADSVFYVLEDAYQGEESIGTFRSRSLGRSVHLERGILKRLVRGKDIGRYTVRNERMYAIFPYTIADGRPVLMPESDLKALYPLTWEYLSQNRTLLEGRERGRFAKEGWYCYGRPQNMTRFDVPKILTPDVALGPQMALDAQGTFHVSDTAYCIAAQLKKLDLHYLLAILNSGLTAYYLRIRGTFLRGGYGRFKKQYLHDLPFIRLVRQDKAQANQASRLSAHARRMLDLHRRLAAKGGVRDNEREEIEREIAITDRQIDDLVYDLYGLTANERALVETEVRR